MHSTVIDVDFVLQVTVFLLFSTTKDNLKRKILDKKSIKEKILYTFMYRSRSILFFSK